MCKTISDISAENINIIKWGEWAEQTSQAFVEQKYKFKPRLGITVCDLTELMTTLNPIIVEHNYERLPGYLKRYFEKEK